MLLSHVPMPQEEKYFEGTGGVLLDVSHTSPHPYHGEPCSARACSGSCLLAG